MGTSATIWLETKQNTFKGISVNSDGYEEHTGKMLVKHYSDLKSIKSLLKLGELSFLNSTLETTIAYHRDKGEKLNKAIVVNDLGNVISSDNYVYVNFLKKGWKIIDNKTIRDIKF